MPPKQNIPWRIAKSLLKLKDQVNKKFPTRAKASDGGIGDDKHASRDSDHNPWVVDPDGGPNVVTALDITCDPKDGADTEALAETLRKNQDPRIKYVIYNKRIYSSKVQPWVWRKYTGKNPHVHHFHISVMDKKSLYDSEAPWVI